MSDPIEKTIKVAGVETKSGGEDSERPWTLYRVVDDDGKKASTFDKRIGMLLVSLIGKYATVVIEKTEKGWNLKDAKPADGPAPKTSNGNGGYDAETIERFKEKDLHIARQAALKAVCDLASGTGADMGSILVLADRAVRWIYSGKDAAIKAEAGSAAAGVTPAGAEASAPATPDLDAAIREATSDKVVTRILDVRWKQVSTGKRFSILTSGEETYYTFSETLAKALKKAKDAGVAVTLFVRASDFGVEVFEVGEASDVLQGEMVTVPS